LPSAPTLILSPFACALRKLARQRRLFDEKRAVARIDVGQFDEAVGDVANSSTGGLLF
jgi:hypothetical protein